ncbi:MAG: glutamate-5-semialdehyde dehydrogenase [Dehalococcoidia bacterium]|nr:glutamate-5-semialdehyde dehydrogenase [Dehalococcoidia bacterium]
MDGKTDLQHMGRRARAASRALAKTSTSVKNGALQGVADALVARKDEILAANSQDIDAGRRDGLSEQLLGRLALDGNKLEGMAGDVRKVAELADPTDESFDETTLANGLEVAKRRVPLGVIGVVYESRPNVTIDISSLCLKSGNAVILRGGKEAIRSNGVLAQITRDAIAEAGIADDAVQFVESTDRALVGEMLGMTEFIDLIVPRGSAELVRRVGREAQMPAITGGIGVCHTFVDKTADVDMAADIAFNAKTSSPYVCNALDTLIVHSGIASEFLPKVAGRLGDSGVELRCDRRARSIIGNSNGVTVASAMDDDWGTEFLALTAAIKVVDSLDEALDHIELYGSGHTDVIVTEDDSSSQRFLNEVDSGVVLVNASSRFNDGGQLGLGAEVAISTNKMHARGPIGLKELTSYKWTVVGSGQVRN